MVLETFGSGNGPSKPDLLQELRAAAQRGLIMVNCSQCLRGSVTPGYATSLVRAGSRGWEVWEGAGQAWAVTATPFPSLQAGANIVSGLDMTSEAALAKLSYVLGLPELSLERRQEVHAQSAVCAQAPGFAHAHMSASNACPCPTWLGDPPFSLGNLKF